LLSGLVVDEQAADGELRLAFEPADVVGAKAGEGLKERPNRFLVGSRACAARVHQLERDMIAAIEFANFSAGRGDLIASAHQRLDMSGVDKDLARLDSGARSPLQRRYPLRAAILGKRDRMVDFAGSESAHRQAAGTGCDDDLTRMDVVCRCAAYGN